MEKNLALGNRYLSEMEFEKAVTSFSKVVRIDDKNTEAHIGLGDAYSGLGRWVEAADSYDNAVQTVVERVFVGHPERKETAETVIRDEVMKKAGLDDSGHEYMKGEELAAIFYKGYENPALHPLSYHVTDLRDNTTYMHIE